MAKTELTRKLENDLYKHTQKMGTFSCFEVTIGFGGNERVDYMTYDTKGIWRCYEIKVSVSDFRSKAKNTFCGHYNYYVMPRELYDKVKDEIPADIGVFDGYASIKRATKQQPTVDEETLKQSMIRSLSRQFDKLMKSEDPFYTERMEQKVREAQKSEKLAHERYTELEKTFQERVNKHVEQWKEMLT